MPATMILRQLINRHGRTVLSTSSRTTRRARRWYATEVNIDNPIHRQSERDHKPTRSIPGHPDDPSSIIDAIGHEGTPGTAHLEAAVDESAHINTSLQGEVNALRAARHGGTAPPPTAPHPSLPAAPYESLTDFWQSRTDFETATHHGSVREDEYKPWQLLVEPPAPEEVTLPMLLANQCHLGHATALWHPGNSSYIFGIRDGIHIISLEITLSYLRRAAKVVQEVARRGGIILFVGTKKGMHEIVVNAAARAKSYHIFSRWVPGSLTNGQQILEKCAVKVVNPKDEELEQYKVALATAARPVLRPDLVICLNPIENEVCLHECGLYNVPTIGIVDTDVNSSWVTYPIPANDDSPRSVGLIAGALSRAAERGQMMRYKEAEMGRTTYDTKHVQRYLKGMEELARVSAEAQERGGGDRDRGRNADLD